MIKSISISYLDKDKFNKESIGTVILSGITLDCTSVEEAVREFRKLYPNSSRYVIYGIKLNTEEQYECIES